MRRPVAETGDGGDPPLRTHFGGVGEYSSLPNRGKRARKGKQFGGITERKV